MRKCLRCDEYMIEDYNFTIWGFGSDYIHIKKNNKKNEAFSGEPKLAICPNCGEVSVYIQDTSKLKNNNLK